MSYREQGKEALSSVLKHQQNICIIEKYIYNISKSDDKAYKIYLYQIVGDILDGKKLKNILIDIREKKIGWDHSTFKEMQNMLNEQNDFIENPFAVEEGVLKCEATNKDGKFCGSKRVFSYQKQVRNSDEPMTTFATCCKCGTKWQYSG